MEDWILNNGITFTQFEISSKNDSFSIIAKEDIPIDSVIAKIPKESILSTRNCSISQLFHSEEYGEQQNYPMIQDETTRLLKRAIRVCDEQ